MLTGVPRPAYSKERVDELQAEILEAAVGVLEEKSPAGLTLRAIAERMGWSPAALYRYFPSKDALLAALRAEGFKRFAADLEEVGAVEADASELVRRGIRAYLGFARSQPALFRLMYQLDQEADPSPAYVQEARQRTFDIALGVGHAAADAGLIEGGGNTAIHVIWAAAHGLASFSLAHQLDLGSSYQEIVEPLTERIAARIAHPGDGARDRFAAPHPAEEKP